MGRIFEVRKHAMFARWNRMAKNSPEWQRYCDCVHAGGPIRQPTRRCAVFYRTPVPLICRRTRPMRRSGAHRAKKRQLPGNLYEGYAPHGVALLVETATDTRPARSAACVIFSPRRRQPGQYGSVSFLFKKWVSFAWIPQASRTETSWNWTSSITAWRKWEKAPGRRAKLSCHRCAFNDFANCRKRSNPADRALSAEHEYICSVRSSFRRSSRRGLGSDR